MKNYMKIKVFVFIITFFISFVVYNFKMLIYTDDNREISMTDLSKDQNEKLKNEMELNEFTTLIIKSVNHETAWGNDIKRYFDLVVTISEMQKSALLSYIENSDKFSYIDCLSDNEYGIFVIHDQTEPNQYELYYPLRAQEEMLVPLKEFFVAEDKEEKIELGRSTIFEWVELDFPKSN